MTSDELQDNNEYVDIKEDVKEECSSSGSVESIVIPRAKDGFKESAEGNVYVSFTDISSAQKASVALSGRKFADRIVTVDYVSAFILQNIIFFPHLFFNI